MLQVSGFGLKSLSVSYNDSLSGVQIRRTTQKNLEFSFSALLLLLSLGGWSWSPEATTVLSTMFAHLQGNVLHDPATLIGDLKAADHALIQWVRGSRKYVSLKLLRRDLSENMANYYHVEAIILFETLFAHKSVAEAAPFLQIVHAFLSLHRVIVLPAATNYTSIVSASSYKKDTKLESMISLALINLGVAPTAFLREFRARNTAFKYILSTKAGPNGHAILDAQLDSAAMCHDEASYKAFTTYTEFARIAHVGTDLVKTIDIRGQAIPFSTARLGRLHVIEEWGGKTRVVAILDYWTQAALDPLHQTLGHFLRHISMDGTYNQDAQVARVQAETKRSEAEVYSFDLSAATDRFPLEFQKSVLAVLLGNENVAKAWGDLLVSRKYWSPDGQARTYAAGQPMGAKSSFPMFALAHHVIIQIAAQQAGLKGEFKDYAIIGDDMTIWNTKVASEYQTIMGTLGVSINLSKSWVHSAGSLPVAELAKRLFLGGIEISAIPVKLIAKVGSNPLNTITLQEILTSRGFYSDPKLAMSAAMGLVDRDTRQRLLLLNALPSEVTGLTRPNGPVTPNLELNSMYSDQLTTEQDVTEAYLYTAVVEQVKRLDALLRESEAANQAVVDKARVPLILVKMTDLPPATTKKLDAIKANLKDFSPFHPLVSATVAEVERISILLSSLRAGVTALSGMAKRQIIDTFRNPITDVVMPKDLRAESVPAFTLVNKALTNMDTLFLDKSGTKLDFSLMLLSLRRHFTVSWIRGSGVYVNSVKTKVEQSVEALSNDITLLASSSYLSPRRNRSGSGPASGSGTVKGQDGRGGKDGPQAPQA